MTPETQAQCLNLLAGMLSPSQPWSEHVAALYALAMDGWDDQIAIETVKFAALSEEWRPAPVKLRQIALRFAHPLPDPAAILAEMRRVIVRVSPGNRRKALVSHPLVHDMADAVGGWDTIGMFRDGGLDEAFAAAWTSTAKDWQSRAGLQSGLVPTSGALQVSQNFETHPDVSRFIARQWGELEGAEAR